MFHNIHDLKYYRKNYRDKQLNSVVLFIQKGYKMARVTPLTDTEIKQAKRKEKSYLLSDGGGTSVTNK